MVGVARSLRLLIAVQREISVHNMSAFLESVAFTTLYSQVPLITPTLHTLGHLGDQMVHVPLLIWASSVLPTALQMLIVVPDASCI